MERKYFDIVLASGARIVVTVNREGNFWRATWGEGITQSDSDVGASAMESVFRVAANFMLFESWDVREVVVHGEPSRAELLGMRNAIVELLR
jgi:hypothetical protein